MSKRAVPTWAVLAVCCIAQFMVVLDVSIVNVALPAMRHDLGLSPTGQQWVVNAYTLTFAGLPAAGRPGGRPVRPPAGVPLGLGLFTVCSLVGGLAQTGGDAHRRPRRSRASAAPPGPGHAEPADDHVRRARRAPPGARRLVARPPRAAARLGVLLGGVLTDLLTGAGCCSSTCRSASPLAAGASLALTESRADERAAASTCPAPSPSPPAWPPLVYGIVSTDTHSWGSAQHGLGTLAAAGAPAGRVRPHRVPASPTRWCRCASSGCARCRPPTASR